MIPLQQLSQCSLRSHALVLTLRHIRQLAEHHNVPMPTMDVAHQHMLSARAHGGDQMDWTALVGGERISAGLQPFGSRVSHLLVLDVCMY